MAARGWRELGWIAVPFAVYLYVLQRLWFDAPILDDYYIGLSNVMSLEDSRSFGEWLGIIVAQHSEHRIAVLRVVAWGIATLMGHMDFRVLTLLGNFTVLGLALVAWAEFRTAVTPPVLGAAAILLMQWSYYEASIMATAALPNIGVVCFASACLFFATRPGPGATVATLAFGLLAVGSQANGLFALPLAAAASLLKGRRARATLLACASIALWVAYFWHYERPPERLSPWLALAQPLATARFFLMVMGSVVPGPGPSTALGAAAIALLAWLSWRGAWKRFPASALCVAFVLLSAAAISAGRAAFGVPPSPRYAIYSTWFLTLASLAAWAELGLAGARAEAISLACSVAVAIGVSWGQWRWAGDLSRAGHMLMKALPADERIGVPDPYLWTLHPGPGESRGILAAAAKRHLYSPPQRLVYAPVLEAMAQVPAEAVVEGAIDEVAATGNRVKLSGWAPIAATTPERIMAVHPAQPMPKLAQYQLAARPDVAMIVRDASLIASGFRAELEYPSEEEARVAAETLCIMVAAPGRRPALLHRVDLQCRNPSAR